MMEPAGNNTRDLNKVGNVIYAQVALVYSLMAACIFTASSSAALPLYAFLLVSFFSWIVIGWGQFALFNALHEGLHKRFGAPHRESLANVLTAYPLGFSEAYRKIHLDHHKYFGNPAKDPDYASYANFPTNKRQFLRRLLVNVCGLPAVLQFFGLRQGSEESKADLKKNKQRLAFFKMALTQLVILSVFHLTIGWFYYVWLWLLPLATFGKFFSSTRTFCEHANPDNTATIRTITGSFLGEKIMGVFSFHYHAEHHEYVGIPYNRLREAHSEYKSKLYQSSRGDSHFEHYDQGYFALLWKWYTALPNQ